MRTNSLNKNLRNVICATCQIFLLTFAFGQTKFYFYSGGTNANNGFSVNTGGSWSTVNYPTYTDAENLTNAGCLSMNCSASIVGGNYLNSSGSNLSSWSPKWQNVSATYDWYGQRIYCDFTSSNSTTSYATVVYTFTSSGSAINLPITFDLFDINSGAYTLDASSLLNFIDNVQITARTSAGVSVNPIFSNQCGSPTDEFGTNTIKGNNSCGASPTRDVTVSFGQNISELTIKYMPGSGEPGNIAAATTTGTGFPIATSYDPGKQYIDISPIRVGSTTPTISSQPTNASICTTGSATLSVTASSGPYQWQYNNAGTWQNVANATPTGVTYSGQTTNSLSISASNVAAGTYSYRCVVGASCSSVNSSTATLTVSTINTTGMVANEWVWTGAQSTTYETASNWLSWNGTSSFTIPAAAPTTSNSVRIKQVSGCISNSPIVTTTSAASNKITIETSAQLTSNNSTNLTVAGNWSNSGNYIEQNGKVTFAGASQTITSSTAGGETYYDLTVNSGATVTISQNVSVSNGLRLNGVVSTGSNFLLVTTTAADGVSAGIVDGNYSGHVVGNLRRTIQSNTATYRFPMGVTTTATSGRRLLEFINNSITNVGHLDCSVTASFKGSGNNVDAWLSTTNAVMGTGPFLIQTIHSEAQWRLTPSATPTGGNYGIRLYTQNFTSLSGKDNQFTVLKRTDGSSTFADFSSFNSSTTIPSSNAAGRIYDSGNGYAERLGFVNFSEFVIGSYSTPVVLGVELQNYLITCSDNGYEFSYTTASESNSSHFEILTSTNGYDYTLSRVIQSAGTTNEISSYQSFIPKNESKYLKLDQYDLDGQFTNLLVLSLPVCTNDPRPFLVVQDDFLNASLYTEGLTEIHIFSSDGKLVYKNQLKLEKTDNFNTNINNLTSGTYFLISTNEKSEKQVLRFKK